MNNAVGTWQCRCGTNNHAHDERCGHCRRPRSTRWSVPWGISLLVLLAVPIIMLVLGLLLAESQANG